MLPVFNILYLYPPQIEVHPFNSRRRLVEFCQSHGIVVEAYSPLAKATKLSNPTLLEVSQKSAVLLGRLSEQ